LMMVGGWGEILTALIVGIATILAAAFGLELLGHLRRRLLARSGSGEKLEPTKPQEP